MGVRHCSYQLWEAHRHPARIGVHRPRRLQAGRGRARQGDRARRHADRHRAAARRLDARHPSCDDSRDTRGRPPHASRSIAGAAPSGHGPCRRRGTLGNYRAIVDGRQRQAEVDGTAPTPRPRASGCKPVNGSFLVAAYRRPDFRVDATLDGRTPAIAGAPLQATLAARYLFGGAMAKRPVQWTLTREHADVSIPAAITDERFRARSVRLRLLAGREIGLRRREIAGATAALDAGERATLTLDLGRRRRDVRLRLSVHASKATSRTCRGSTSPTARRSCVHPAPWYIGLRRPPYFVRGREGRHAIDVVAVGLDGRGRAGRHRRRVARPRAVELRAARRRRRLLRVGDGAQGGAGRRLDGHDRQSSRRAAARSASRRRHTTSCAPTAKDSEGRTTRTDLDFYAHRRRLHGVGAIRPQPHQPRRPRRRPGSRARRRAS